MRALGYMIAATLAFYSAVGKGQEGDFDVSLSTVLTMDSAYETNSDQFQKLEFIAMPELGIDFDDLSLTAIVRARFDGENRLEPREPEQHTVATQSQRHFVSDNAEIELRELFLDIPIGSAFLRLGKQQVVWGQADGLKVLDVVNPQVFREFVLDEFEDSRIPLWSANLELPMGDGTLQLLWVADQTYHDLPETDAAYAITAPFTSLPQGVPVTVARADVPDRVIEDSDAGARYSWFAGGWDLTLNYFYHYNDLPVIRRGLSATGLLLSPSYERTHLLGGTGTTALGDFTLRGEFGYSSDGYFPTEATTLGDGVKQSGEFSSVIGIDYSGLTDSFISGQLFQSTVLDYDDAISRSQTELNASLLVRRTFANETVEAQMLWIQSLSGEGALIRPRVRVDYSTRWQFEVYADIFEGDPEGLFGQFDSRDRIGIAVTVSL